MFQDIRRLILSSGNVLHMKRQSTASGSWWQWGGPNLSPQALTRDDNDSKAAALCMDVARSPPTGCASCPRLAGARHWAWDRFAPGPEPVCGGGSGPEPRLSRPSPFPGSRVQEAAFYCGPFSSFLSPGMPVKRYVRNVSLQVVSHPSGPPACKMGGACEMSAGVTVATTVPAWINLWAGTREDLFCLRHLTNSRDFYQGILPGKS